MVLSIRNVLPSLKVPFFTGFLTSLHAPLEGWRRRLWFREKSGWAILELYGFREKIARSQGSETLK